MTVQAKPMQNKPLHMPGATMVTRLKVYDSVTPDGQRGGTPHVHLLCTEMYFVTAGSGSVEMLDWQGYSKTELKLHDALVFSPGTLHRLINPEGDLELLIIMQNSGLPERGDNVVTFRNDLLSTDETYQKAMKVSGFAEAQARRDKGVEGFTALKTAFEQSLETGREALGKFYALAAERTKTLRSNWQDVVENGPLQEAQDSLTQLELLSRGQHDYLENAQQFHIGAGAFETPGFCGALNRYFDPASLELEGTVKGNKGDA